VVFPSVDSLSLSEAVALVRERRDCSEDEAKNALRRAGLDGRLEAIGSIPLSAHPNPDVRARHSARKREALRAADWDSDIDWIAGTVGRYFSVTIKRTSIETWLDMGCDAQAIPTLRNATTKMIKDAIRAAYDKADTAKGKPPNLVEIAKVVRADLRATGFHASGKRVQELARDDEFSKRRRPPGVTLMSEKLRQER
jgi:hypothetical protein